MSYHKPVNSLKEAEKEFRLKIDEPFFAEDGVSLTAVNGFECPMVRLKTVDGTDILLNRHNVLAFVRGFDKARDWAEGGWTDGMC